MKLKMVVLLGIMLTPSVIVAQEKLEASKKDQGMSAKALVVFGRVSNDAKLLLTDIDSEWIVSNADVLKGYEGHVVRVKCFVNTEKNRIQVLWVRNDKESKYAAARTSDSAFRR